MSETKILERSGQTGPTVLKEPELRNWLAQGSRPLEGEAPQLAVPVSEESLKELREQPNLLFERSMAVLEAIKDPKAEEIITGIIHATLPESEIKKIEYEGVLSIPDALKRLDEVGLPTIVANLRLQEALFVDGQTSLPNDTEMMHNTSDTAAVIARRAMFRGASNGDATGEDKSFLTKWKEQQGNDNEQNTVNKRPPEYRIQIKKALQDIFTVNEVARFEKEHRTFLYADLPKDALTMDDEERRDAVVVSIPLLHDQSFRLGREPLISNEKMKELYPVLPETEVAGVVTVGVYDAKEYDDRLNIAILREQGDNGEQEVYMQLFLPDTHEYIGKHGRAARQPGRFVGEKIRLLNEWQPIGRHADILQQLTKSANVELPPTVSREHCEIRLSKNGIEVHNKQPYNSTIIQTSLKELIIPKDNDRSAEKNNIPHQRIAQPAVSSSGVRV